MFYYTKSNYDESEKHMLKAYEHNKSFKFIYNLCILYSTYKKDDDKALMYCELTLSSFKLEEMTHREQYYLIVKILIKTYESKGDHELALKYTKDIEDIEQHSGFVNYIRGKIFYKESNYPEAIKFLLIACECKYIYAPFQLGNYYLHIEKNIPNAKKYYIMGTEIGHYDCYRYIANICVQHEKNIQQGIELYLEGIKHKCKISMYSLAIIYKKQQKYREALTYALMARENKHFLSYGLVATLYFIMNDIPSSIESCHIGIKEKCRISMHYLGMCYYKMGNLEAATEYLTMAFLHEYKLSLEILKTFLSPLELYILIDMEKKTSFIPLNNDINIFKNKINLAPKVGSCPICLSDDVRVIPLNCCHYICSDNCYAKIIKTHTCPECKLSI
jgi:tetratricopeptide (TPR) repeat protein